MPRTKINKSTKREEDGMSRIDAINEMKNASISTIGKVEKEASAIIQEAIAIVKRVKAENVELVEALRAMTDHYAELINSGDAGFWNPEDEQPVIKARALIAKHTADK